MRWFRIRKANLLPATREILEQLGVAVVQQRLALDTNFSVNLTGRERLTLPVTRDDMLAWLTEQFDGAERKETWSITMEAAITVFVLAELLLTLFHYKKS